MTILKRGFAILRAPEGDNNGGGGGSGGGGDPPKENEPPKALSVEDVGRIVNQAVTSHLGRLNLDGKINEAITGLKLNDKFDSITKALEGLNQPKPPAPSGGGGNKPAVDPEIAAQLKQLSEQVEQERAARVAAVKEAEKTRSEHEFGAARQRLYEALKPHSIENLHNVWVDNLIHHERLKVEDGKQYLEVEYIPFPGSPKQKDFLPLDEAIRVLITTDEAKVFMPPPEPGDGSRGNPGPRNARRSTNTPSLDSKDPYERVKARLASMGIDADKEFS